MATVLTNQTYNTQNKHKKPKQLNLTKQHLSQDLTLLGQVQTGPQVQNTATTNAKNHKL